MDDEKLKEIELCLEWSGIRYKDRVRIRELIFSYRLQKRRLNTILGILEFKRRKNEIKTLSGSFDSANNRGPSLRRHVSQRDRVLKSCTG